MQEHTKPFNVRIPSWIDKEMIGEAKNKSMRIQELIIKGYMYEKQHDPIQNARNYIDGIKEKDGQFRIHSRDFTDIGGFPSIATTSV